MILRNLSAAAGGGFSTGSIDNLRDLTAEALMQAVDQTKESYKRMVDFLATQIRVESAEVIPYSNQLTVLAELFRRLPSPNVDQYAAVQRWFWRTALAGYFGGWNTGNMSSDLAAVRRFVEGASDEVEVSAIQPSADIWKVRQFRANNAHAKLLAIVLAHHGPIDLLTGQRIDTAQALAWINSKEFHHFFPQDFLRGKGEGATRINALANIVMLSSASNKKISAKSPSLYLKDVEAAAGSNLPQWLASNLISEAAYEAATRDDYDGFLAERSATIHAELIPKAGWDES